MLPNILKITLIILFLACLFDMPYSYYQLVRFAGVLGFALLAYFEKDQKDKTWLFIWAASALLINPFIKVVLGRELWNVVDVIWAILLGYSMLVGQKPVKE